MRITGRSGPRIFTLREINALHDTTKTDVGEDQVLASV
jgi:hypothetical protein